MNLPMSDLRVIRRALNLAIRDAYNVLNDAEGLHGEDVQRDIVDFEELLARVNRYIDASPLTKKVTPRAESVSPPPPAR